MLRKCVYFEQKSTQTEKPNLSDCSPGDGNSLGVAERFPWHVAWEQTGLFCTQKDGFFGKFDPIMETFLECETICRKPPPGHVFVESLAEIDPRKVVEVVSVVLISTSVFQFKKFPNFYTKVRVSPPKGVTWCGPHQPQPLGTPLPWRHNESRKIQKR